MKRRRNAGRVFVLMTVAVSLATWFSLGCCNHCFLSGPSVEQPPPYYDGNIYYPIQLGNRWVFNEASRDTGNTLIRSCYDTLTRYGVFYTWMLERMIDTSGATVSRADELFNMATDTLYVSQFETVSGDSITVLDRETERLLNPLRPNDTLAWVPRDRRPNFGDYYWHIGSVDTNITNADTTWEGCLETYLTFNSIMWDTTYLLRRTYFSPDIGPVLIVDYPYTDEPGDLGDTLTRWELESWIADPVVE